MIKTAVILAAGRGSRLGPYTEAIPKCLVEVGGISILDRMLKILNVSGVKKVIMVLGYRSDSILNQVESWRQSLDIVTIINHEWETTNNVLSLQKAIPEIHEDFYLLESDLVFTQDIFKKMNGPDRIAVSAYLPTMNGTGVVLNQKNQVTTMFANSEYELVPGEKYKTVNIYSFSFDRFNSVIAPEIQTLLDGKQMQAYYELGFSHAIRKGLYTFDGVDFSEARWCEIDTEEDLLQAEKLFPG